MCANSWIKTSVNCSAESRSRSDAGSTIFGRNTPATIGTTTAFETSKEATLSSHPIARHAAAYAVFRPPDVTLIELRTMRASLNTATIIRMATSAQPISHTAQRQDTARRRKT